MRGGIANRIKNAGVIAATLVSVTTTAKAAAQIKYAAEKRPIKATAKTGPIADGQLISSRNQKLTVRPHRPKDSHECPMMCSIRRGASSAIASIIPDLRVEAKSSPAK